jgi:hypothetical protein
MPRLDVICEKLCFRIQDRLFRANKVYEPVRFVADFLDPKHVTTSGSINDPNPFFADIRNLMRKMLRHV